MKSLISVWLGLLHLLCSTLSNRHLSITFFATVFCFLFFLFCFALTFHLFIYVSPIVFCVQNKCKKLNKTKDQQLFWHNSFFLLQLIKKALSYNLHRKKNPLKISLLCEICAPDGNCTFLNINDIFLEIYLVTKVA